MTKFIYNTIDFKLYKMNELKTAFNKEMNNILDFLKKEDHEIYFSPSDFDTVDLSQTDLDSLFI